MWALHPTAMASDSTGFPESVEGIGCHYGSINDMVVRWVTTKLQSGQPVDVGFMAGEITGSLIDMVLQQEE